MEKNELLEMLKDQSFACEVYKLLQDANNRQAAPFSKRNRKVIMKDQFTDALPLLTDAGINVVQLSKGQYRLNKGLQVIDYYLPSGKVCCHDIRSWIGPTEAKDLPSLFKT